MSKSTIEDWKINCAILLGLLVLVVIHFATPTSIVGRYWVYGLGAFAVLWLALKVPAWRKAHRDWEASHSEPPSGP